MFPPAVICAAVKYFNEGPRQTRLFNHSINVSTPCRTQHMSAWTAGIDALSEQRDILIIQSAGNLLVTNPAPFCGVQEHLNAGREYPHYLIEDSCRVANPAQSLQALTVGSVAYDAFNQGDWSSFAPGAGYPSAFSRTGFGIWDVIKPEVVEYGGDLLRTKNTPPDISTPDHAQQCYPELVRSTMYPPGPAVDRDNVGTSFSAPKVTNIAALLEESLPDDNCLLYRALIIQSARWPQWAWDTPSENQLDILRQIGYGVPNSDRATTNTDYRTTLVVSKDPDDADQDLKVKAGEAHIYQVPIPEAMRRPGDEFDVLIEVTLSYAAQPRRTRRNPRHYLSTWVDWKSSKLEESLDSFRIRVLKEQEEGPKNGSPIPWMLTTNPIQGKIRGVKRNAGTVQKDWAVVKSNALPESFCIAVVGHKGWSKDPDSSAKYALTVSFEMLGQEIEIYEKIRLSVEELSVEIEVENEIEEEIEE